MEKLLDLADALVVASQPEQEPDPPDFDLPEEFGAAAVPTDKLLQLRESSTGGKGWYAAQDLPAGTLLLVAKPIGGMVMDWEDDSGEVEEMEQDDDDDDEEEEKPDEDETEGRMNELLYLELLRQLRDKPALWFDCLSALFPRDKADLSSLPAAWVIADDELFVEVELAITNLKQVPELQPHVQDIVSRLPLIVRYNVLSVETCSELLSYPGPKGHACLAGVVLYHLPSFFNHSCRPNCGRWAVGDVMVFVANQNIKAGTEVCISYLEHDVLCESAGRRNRLLNMDFSVVDDVDNGKGGDQASPPSPVVVSTPQQQQHDDDEEDGPALPVVDTDVQNELMAMDPFSRLLAIEELMEQAAGAKVPDGEGEEAGPGGEPSPVEAETGAVVEADDGDSPMQNAVDAGWFQCDIHNLRILKAITLDGLGQTAAALKLWEESIAFVDDRMPPLDESSVVLRVQAALCAHHKGDADKARQHARAALQTHHLLFGGGVARFRRRFRHDLELRLRPAATATATAGGEGGTTTTDTSAAAVDLLWPTAEP